MGCPLTAAVDPEALVSAASCWPQSLLQTHDSIHSVETDLGDGPFLFDYSKNLVDGDVMAKLLALVRERGVEKGRDQMFG